MAHGLGGGGSSGRVGEGMGSWRDLFLPVDRETPKKTLPSLVRTWSVNNPVSFFFQKTMRNYFYCQSRQKRASVEW